MFGGYLLMDATHISHHLHEDPSIVEIKSYINQGSKNQSNWISLTIGALSLSIFTPSALGTVDIVKKLQEEIQVCTQNDSMVDIQDLEIILPVEVTAYNADPKQTDSTPNITASGQQVREGICALSRDIEKEYGLKFGDKIEIIGLGIFEFRDRMNKRIKKGVDVFKKSLGEALQIGRQERKIRFLKRI
jgi:3D (Asp-Asp-Asp) domain-containing protein